MSESPFSPLEQTVVIVGVGLIGGSLASALRQRRIARTVIGVGRDLSRLENARKLGLIDEGSTDLTQVAPRADVIVYCTPVDRIVEGVRLGVGNVRPSTLLTDAGSVKQPICDALADVPNFVGSHPIAGSHQQGFESAAPQLFEGRLCVLTPLSSADESQVIRLDRLWRAVGMRTIRMTPADHDQGLAMTSHLPHLVASALAATLTDENRRLTGTGFRDATRIAAGDPDLWSGILLQNSQHVIQGVESVQQQLSEFRKALESGDRAWIKRLLVDGQTRRALLDVTRSVSGNAENGGA